MDRRAVRRRSQVACLNHLLPCDIVLLVDEMLPRNSLVIGQLLQSLLDEQGFVYRICL
uniref:Uncharacterized protein n=1 Tax=Mola mola TaxID=94237 RepID=A0A3Q3WTN1_MOLML